MRCSTVVPCLLAVLASVTIMPVLAPAAPLARPTPDAQALQSVRPLARVRIFDRANAVAPQPVTLKVEDLAVQVEVAGKQPCPVHGILMGDEEPATAPPTQHCTVATLVAQTPGRPVFRQVIASLITGDEGGMLASLQLALYHLDTSKGPPQILVSGYTMGAHCCTVSAIVGSNPAGQWVVTPLVTQDGDGTPGVVDINHDGGRQFVLWDQRFNYVFAPYVWSVLPLVINDYAQGSLRTVTTVPAYAPFLRAYFRQGFPSFRAPPPPERKVVNGFLAAYVANSANLGQLAAGWTYMLHWYDRHTSDLDTWCALDPSVQAGGITGCPARYVRTIPYPQKLALFLLKTGYITPAQCAALGYDPARIQVRQAATRAANTVQWRAAHPPQAQAAPASAR